MLLGMYIGRSRMTRLAGWKTVLPQPAPTVTILVPAKDEGTGIQTCINAILAQDYPDFSVITINDRSKDDTGVVLDQMAAANSRVSVVHIPAGGLPEGWLGKCHALFVGAKQATSEWLLFVDSDVTLQPNALSSALSICIQRKYDALSLLTRLECHGFLEELMLPPLAMAWTVMYMVSLTNDDGRPERAVANGQFFLVKRAAYEKVGGHETVKDQITEDVELMRALKADECRCRLFLGQHLASTRMHSRLGQMFNGWARIFSGTSRRSPWKILWAFSATLFGVYTVYPALFWGFWSRDLYWLEASAAHFAMMTLHLSLIYHWSGNRAKFAWLVPIAGALMLGIFVYALRKCQTGTIVWRDTHFAPQRR